MEIFNCAEKSEDFSFVKIGSKLSDRQTGPINFYFDTHLRR